MVYKIVQALWMGMLIWVALYPDKAHAGKNYKDYYENNIAQDYYKTYERFGVKLGISSASFWDRWKDLKHFELQGDVKKGNFFGKPFFLGSVYLERGINHYLGWEVGLGYLRQGGCLTVEKQSGARSEAYLKIIQHTITIPLGFCIYPFKLEEEEDVWKIAAGFAINIIPKRKWFTKGPDQDAEEEAKLSDDMKILLERQNIDLAFYLGTGYEWACGLSVDVRGTIGSFSILRSHTHKYEPIYRASDAYAALKDKCKKMRNYYFTITLGYSLFRR